jgi:hypothetical protein
VYTQVSESPLTPLGKGGTGLQSPPYQGGFWGIKPKDFEGAGRSILLQTSLQQTIMELNYNSYLSSLEPDDVLELFGVLRLAYGFVTRITF